MRRPLTLIELLGRMPKGVLAPPREFLDMGRAISVRDAGLSGRTNEETLALLLGLDMEESV